MLGLPGLQLQEWISSGTDVLQGLASVTGVPPSGAIIFCTLLMFLHAIMSAEWHRQLSGRLLSERKQSGVGEIFGRDCFTWVRGDAVVYGNRGLLALVMAFDNSGRASGVAAQAMNVPMLRVKKRSPVGDY